MQLVVGFARFVLNKNPADLLWDYVSLEMLINNIPLCADVLAH